MPTSVTGEVISVSVATRLLGLARWRLQFPSVLQKPLGHPAARASDVSQRASGDVEDGEPAVREFDFEFVHG